VHRRRRRHGGGAGAGLSTILVIGASRGIGLEFVRQYREAWDRVFASARDDAGLQRVEALGAKALRIDVTDPASVSGLGWQLDGEKIDIAIYVAGVMSRGGAKEPPSQEEFDRVMRTNVWGAMQVIPQVAPLVEAARGRFAFISSEMGYIAGVESSYGWAYRASKAALNMTVASAQADYPHATMVAVNPGWVQTDMGGAGAPLTVEQSVAAMRNTLAGKLQAASFVHYDGRRYKGW
jgi:NAD(P)-dependent dehydrogenase (short-subunit alcohol dehydrogenase family)